MIRLTYALRCFLNGPNDKLQLRKQRSSAAQRGSGAPGGRSENPTKQVHRLPGNALPKYW